MFGLFSKRKEQSPEEQRAKSLPLTKKVQFEDLPINRVEADIDEDIRRILGYVPTNYYAVKSEYLLCVFFYTEDYSEIYMRFERHINDKPQAFGKFRKIDKELMRDILRKFGIGI